MMPSYTHHLGLMGHRRYENNLLSEDVWQSVGPGPSRGEKRMILRHYVSFTQPSPGNLFIPLALAWVRGFLEMLSLVEGAT